MLVCIGTHEVSLACGLPEAPHALSGDDGQLPLQKVTAQHERQHESAAAGAVESTATFIHLDVEAPWLHRLDQQATPLLLNLAGSALYGLPNEPAPDVALPNAICRDKDSLSGVPWSCVRPDLLDLLVPAIARV